MVSKKLDWNQARDFVRELIVHQGCSVSGIWFYGHKNQTSAFVNFGSLEDRNHFTHEGSFTINESLAMRFKVCDYFTGKRGGRRGEQS